MCIQTRRILLINADDAINEVLLFCLETIPGCEVVTANNGIETISKALEADAILLDLDRTMPDLPWQEILQVLKKILQLIPSR